MANKVNLLSARENVCKAIDILADAVQSTMGPGGQNVLLETQAGMPIITKDGVTVEKLDKLRPAFKKDGTVTAGTASHSTVMSSGASVNSGAIVSSREIV